MTDQTPGCGGTTDAAKRLAESTATHQFPHQSHPESTAGHHAPHHDASICRLIEQARDEGRAEALVPVCAICGGQRYVIEPGKSLLCLGCAAPPDPGDVGGEPPEHRCWHRFPDGTTCRLTREAHDMPGMSHSATESVPCSCGHDEGDHSPDRTCRMCWARCHTDPTMPGMSHPALTSATDGDEGSQL